MSPDGAYVYVSHYDTCSVSVVDLATGSANAVALRDAPLAVAFSPDSRHAYVRNVRSLAVIDTTTNDADDIDTGDLPRGLQLSPDGKRAYSPISAIVRSRFRHDHELCHDDRRPARPSRSGGGQSRRGTDLCGRLLVRYRRGDLGTDGDLHADVAS